MAVALGCWLFNQHMQWIEATCTCIISLVISVVFYKVCVYFEMVDQEVWSGQVSQSRYVPRWQEYYEYEVYRTEYYTVTVDDYSTDSKGRRNRSGSHTEQRSRQVFDHWESSTRWHNSSWSYSDTLNGTRPTDENFYNLIVSRFGATGSAPGSRTTSSHNSRFIGGDSNDYYAINKNNYIFPTVTIKTWENRVKSSVNTYKYHAAVANSMLFDYPLPVDSFNINRALGNTGITALQIDQLNSRIGPTKKCNLILIGFGNVAMELAQEQESKWFGGKKNDLVICVGGEPTKPTWCYIFGWTEADAVKVNLEDLIMAKGLSQATLPAIEQEINKDYVLKDWHKFDYLDPDIPMSKAWWLVLIQVIYCAGAITFCILNPFNKVDKVDKPTNRFIFY